MDTSSLFWCMPVASYPFSPLHYLKKKQEGVNITVIIPKDAITNYNCFKKLLLTSVLGLMQKGKEYSGHKVANFDRLQVKSTTRA